MGSVLVVRPLNNQIHMIDCSLKLTFNNISKFFVVKLLNNL